MATTFDVSKFDVPLFDSICARGLSSGVGQRDGQMCIEAAICTVMGLEHGDDPGCVAASVRSFKIRLNDSGWTSPAARAVGLRDLGLAQLGSLGVLNDKEFATRMVEKTIRVLIPKLFRQVFNGNRVLLAAAARCEAEGTQEAVLEAKKHAAAAADAAAKHRTKDDTYLILAASLALETLRELNSPGCTLLDT